LCLIMLEVLSKSNDAEVGKAAKLPLMDIT
jgi:hypothetical protein